MRIAAFDLGGTNYKSAFFENDRLVRFEQTASLSGYLPKNSVEFILQKAKAFKVDAIGISIAGAVDKGVVLQSPNFTYFDGFPIRKSVEEASGTKTVVENDANCAAWAAHLIYKKKKLLFITLGTGVGGGIVYDNRLISGGVSSEIGHITILPAGPKCHCGNRGCLEALAGGWAIKRELAKNGYAVSVEQMFGLSERDMRLRRLVLRIGNYLGIAIASVANLFSPELIILGGKISLSFDYFSAPLLKSFSHRVFESLKSTPIVVSDIEHEELIGAKFLAKASIKNEK